MSLAEGSINRIINNKSIIIYSSILAIIYCIFDFSNPITALIFGFSAIGEGNIINTVISIIQMITAPTFLIKVLLYLVLGILLGSVALAIILSGYLFKINNVVNSVVKSKGEFLLGTKLFFKRIFIANLKIFSFWITFIFFISIVIVPALFTTASWISGKSQLAFFAGILNFVTLFVTFFIYMSAMMYSLYYYPAIYNEEKALFKVVKENVNESFWSLFGGWLLIGFAFVLFEIASLYIKYKIVFLGQNNIVQIAMLFSSKAIFLTIFISYISVYTFLTYKKIKAK